jgi:hypothetical protein
MIRHRYLLFFLIGVSFQYSEAQETTINRWHVAGGMTIPSSPAQFYDYWKNGFQVMGGAELSSESRYIQFITAEINYFPFDQSRFLKRLGIENSGSSVNGAGTFIFSAAYFIRYSFIEYQSFRPTFFAGVSLSDIYRSSATMEYPNFPVTESSDNSFAVGIPFGFSFMVYQRGDNEIEVNYTYSLGILKNANANSTFTCLKIDYSFSP